MFMGWVGPKERPLCCSFQKYRLHRLAAEIVHLASQNEALIEWSFAVPSSACLIKRLENKLDLILHILSMLLSLLFELFFAENHFVFFDLQYVPPTAYQSDLQYSFPSMNIM